MLCDARAVKSLAVLSSILVALVGDMSADQQSGKAQQQQREAIGRWQRNALRRMGGNREHKAGDGDWQGWNDA